MTDGVLEAEWPGMSSAKRRSHHSCSLSDEKMQRAGGQYAQHMSGAKVVCRLLVCFHKSDQASVAGAG